MNRTYTIADSGGHVVTLIMQVQNHGHELKANIVSVQYGNASPVTPTDNRLDFQYSLAKDGSIKNAREPPRRKRSAKDLLLSAGLKS